MKEPEDEAFEDLAKRQGDWGLQGSRKHQIMRYVENKERNDVIEEVAKETHQQTGLVPWQLTQKLWRPTDPLPPYQIDKPTGFHLLLSTGYYVQCSLC